MPAMRDSSPSHPKPPQAQKPSPYIPSPEELGFRRSSSGDASFDESDADPTIDMQFDPSMLAAHAVSLNFGGEGVSEDEAEATISLSVPPNIAQQAASGLRAAPTGPSPLPSAPAPGPAAPQAPTTAPKNNARGSSRKGPPRRKQNQGMMIALVLVGLLFVVLILAFFAFVVFGGDPPAEQPQPQPIPAPSEESRLTPTAPTTLARVTATVDARSLHHP